MSLTARTCYTLTCDTCDQVDECDDMEMQMHYDSPDAARLGTQLPQGDAWLWAEDGTHTCHACLAAAQCAAQGHQWTGQGPGLLWCERCREPEPIETDSVIHAQVTPAD